MNRINHFISGQQLSNLKLNKQITTDAQVQDCVAEIKPKVNVESTFNYQKLEQIFSKKGFIELHEKLTEYAENGTITDLRTEYNSDGQTILVCKYQGEEYTFSPVAMNVATTELSNKGDNAIKKSEVYSTKDLKELGFPSEYLINKYFDKFEDGYQIKQGININNKTITTIEELRTELKLETFDEFINSYFNTEKGSANYKIHDNATYSFVEKDLTSSYIASWLSKNYGLEQAAYYADSDMSDNTKNIIDKFYSDVATKLGCNKEDLSEADIVRYLMTEDKNYSENIHNVYKKAQFFGTKGYMDGLLDNVMDGTLLHQIEELSKDESFASGPDDAMKTVIYNHDSKLMNLPLMKAILSAAGVNDNDSIDETYNKVENFLNQISDNIASTECPKNDWKALSIWLFEKGYIKETSLSEAEIAKYNLTQEEKEKAFYPATDANGNPILDKNGVQKYYYSTNTSIHDVKSDQNVRIPNIMSSDCALGYGYTIVNTAEELQKALNNGENVVLANDIDMSSIENWVPVGTDDNPYTGRIYGNGYTIKNLNISSSNQFTGLFGVFAGYVTDLNIENATVTNNNSEYTTSTGVFAGKIVTLSNSYPANIVAVNIINCNAVGNDYVGLLTGRIENSTGLNNIRTDINNVSTSGTVNGAISGGISGYIDTTSRISNSSSNANVHATKYAGGIVGACDALMAKLFIGGNTIFMCDFTGNISGTDSAGEKTGCLSIDKNSLTESQLKSLESYYYGTILDNNDNFTINAISKENEIFVPKHEHTKNETQDLAILKNYISTDNYDGTSSLDYVYNTETGEKIYITNNNWLEIILNSQLYGLNENEKQILIEKAIDKLWNHSEEIKPNFEESNNTTYLSWIKSIISAMDGKLINSYTNNYGKKDSNINFVEFEVLGQKYHLPIKNENDYRPVVLEATLLKSLCEKYNISYDDMIKYGGLNVFRSMNDETTDFWIIQEDLINDYKHYFGDVTNVLDENGNISDAETIAKVLEKAIPRKKAADEYKQQYGNCDIDQTKFKELCRKYNFDTQYLTIEETGLPNNKVRLNIYNLFVLAYGEEEAKNIDKSYNESNIESLFALVAQNSPAKGADSDSAELVKEPLPSTIYKIEDCLENMQEAAVKLGLTPSKTQGIYYSYDSNGSYIYIWNPDTNKFQAFNTSAQKNDEIKAEFSQKGKALERTEKNIYYEALLQAYINGYNFTNKSPWVCEKDGIYYEYDKEEDVFKKSEKYN